MYTAAQCLDCWLPGCSNVFHIFSLCFLTGERTSDEKVELERRAKAYEKQMCSHAWPDVLRVLECENRRIFLWSFFLSLIFSHLSQSLPCLGWVGENSTSILGEISNACTCRYIYLRCLSFSLAVFFISLYFFYSQRLRAKCRLILSRHFRG